MKKTILTLATLLAFTLTAFSQAPQAIQYQTIIRDAQGDVVANQNVSLRMTILQGPLPGTNVYQETHAVMTNAFGLVNLEIGTGAVQSGTFSAIAWSTGDYHVQVELDLAGGSNYTLMGTTQLLTVPYSFYADTSHVAFNGLADISFSGGELTVTTADGGTQSITILTPSQRLQLGEPLTDLLNSGLTLQDLLDDGATPCDLLDAGAMEDDLYGLSYEGGLIFYVDNSGASCSGLVAAPADSEVSGDFTHPWGCSGTDIAGAPNVTSFPPSGPGAGIGDGATNTTAILAASCITATDAASVASQSQGGYNDWFLPSAGELNLMYVNLKQNGLGNFQNTFYWSSTEFNSDLAWFQSFFSGIQNVNVKDISFRVRAIRAF